MNWKWFLFGGIALLFFLSSDAVKTYREKKKLYQELTKKLEESKRLNQKLAMEVRRLQTDPTMIGEIARKELGLLHPKEIEYRFIVRKSTPPHPHPLPQGAREKKKISSRSRGEWHDKEGVPRHERSRDGERAGSKGED